MPAVFFFLIDVSMNAIQTGATAAACSSISQAIADLPVTYPHFLFIDILSLLLHICAHQLSIIVKTQGKP